MSSRKGKGKTSQILVQPTGKGPEAYKDIDWKTMTDEEAKSVEKDQSMAWKVLSNSQTQSLLGMTVEEMEKSLATILSLSRYQTDLKEATLLDYYTSALWWAKEEGLDPQQSSGFFSVIHTLMANVKDKMTAADNLQELRMMLMGIGMNSGDVNGGLDFLSIKHAKMITDFLESTLFQHYSLYHFLHHGEREEQIICTDLSVEVLPPASMPYPAPLDEGLEEAVYLRHIAPPPEETPEMEEGGDAGEAEGGEAAGGKSDEADANRDADGCHGDAEKAEDAEKEKDILAGVTMEEVKEVFDMVAREMFADLQEEIASKLRDREGDIITRINKIHRIAET